MNRVESVTTSRLGTAVLVIIFTLGLADRSARAASPSTRPGIEVQTKELHARWKDRLAEEKFNVLLSPPYLIAGDGTPQQLAKYRDNTVVAATKALQAQHFKKPPDRPVMILLFESEGPYRRLANKWFDEQNVPHFGFYRPVDRVMLMNVATGLGTLVHELTHALIAPDFPEVPDWFNEGLASLYEQSEFGDNGKSIKGRVNWRLTVLQREVQNETIRPLAELIANEDFRDPDPQRLAINYAQARYLMLYLQEKDLLQKYYTAFRDNCKKDPSGLATLKKLVTTKWESWEQFEQDWQKWVMGLQIPR